MLELRDFEKAKYDKIKNVVENGGNIKNAAMDLSCSVRSIYRLISVYKEKGAAGFIHGNRGRKPVHALDSEVKEAIIDLYDNKYYDSNFAHYSELLVRYEDIKISSSTIRKLLYSNNYTLSPKARKITRKNVAKIYREMKKGAISKKEEEAIDSAILSLEDAHPRRPRCAYAGELIQMDASVFEWFGGVKTHLHIAVDDSTGELVGAYFDTQETLKGYYNITHQMIANYGIPFKLLTDKRTVFEYTKKGKTKVEDDTFTQYGYACKRLGIIIETSSVSQAKGRVERMFQTLQSRLSVELRLANVTTIEEANEYLNEYKKMFNAKFALPINHTKSVFEKQDDKKELNLTLAVLSSRKIDSGHCIKYHNNYYKLVDTSGEYTHYRKGTEGLVIRAFDDQLFFSTHDKVYALEVVPEHERISKNFDTPVAEEKKEKRYVPPMSHPWKQASFDKYARSQKHRKESIA